MNRQGNRATAYCHAVCDGVVVGHHDLGVIMTDHLPAVTDFDYAVLAAEDAAIVNAAATVIRARLRRSYEDMLECGRQLIAAKAALPHGLWLPWLATECDLAERTAQEFMRSATFVADESAKFADLAPSTVAKLAAAPKAAQAAVIAKVEAGDRVVLSDVIDAVRMTKTTSETPKVPSATCNSTLEMDIRADIDDHLRRNIAAFASSIVALANDVHTVKMWGKTGATTKAWAKDTYKAATGILSTFAGLAGDSYRPSREGYTGVQVAGRTGAALDIVHFIARETIGSSYGDYRAIAVAKITEWRAGFVAAGILGESALRQAETAGNETKA